MFELNENTTIEELEAQKKVLLKGKKDEKKDEVEAAFEEAVEDLPFIKAEKRYDAAIKNHKKMGIGTHIFICENGLSCLLRDPSIPLSAKVMPFLTSIAGSDPDYYKAAKMLVTECWIAGDSEIRKDEDLIAEVGMAALGTVQMKVARSKKK